ncbi:hypothetical protein ACLOJK_022982, partial [Asimina triloba]
MHRQSTRIWCPITSTRDGSHGCHPMSSAGCDDLTIETRRHIGDDEPFQILRVLASIDIILVIMAVATTSPSSP